MSTLADRLTEAMAGPPERKPADLARACKIKPPSVADWLSGKTKKMEGANLLLAAEFLNVDPWWLATGEGKKERRAGVAAPLHSGELDLSEPTRGILDAALAAERRGTSRHVLEVAAELIRNLNGNSSNPGPVGLPPMESSDIYPPVPTTPTRKKKKEEST
jgi:transcriptional regulator with XRE-family HTH domain